MEKQFKVGDKVRLIAENQKGIIQIILDDSITVLLDSDFEEIFKPDELIIDEPLYLDETNIQIKDNKTQKKELIPKKNKLKKPPVVDLHFSQLVDYPNKYKPHERLKIQLETLNNEIDLARKNKHKSLIVIYGKGTGKLEMEVKKVLDSRGLNYWDADFRRYKLGASEVEL